MTLYIIIVPPPLFKEGEQIALHMSVCILQIKLVQPKTGLPNKLQTW